MRRRTHRPSPTYYFYLLLPKLSRTWAYWEQRLMVRAIAHGLLTTTQVNLVATIQ